MFSVLTSCLPIGHQVATVMIKVTTVIVVSVAVANQFYHSLVASSPYRISNRDYLGIPDGSLIPETHRDPSFFGACLMVRDDNQILSEWIAYHYTVLPLRKLVIGQDVNSTQDPHRVLQHWANQTQLDYEVLNADAFAQIFPLRQHGKEDDQKIRDHHALVHRQKGFLSKCATLLKQKGVKWAAFFDTDEFIVPNRPSENDKLMKGNQTLFTIRQGLPSLTQSGLVANVLNQQVAGGIVASCHTVPRLLMGALENRSCDSEALDKVQAPGYLLTTRFFQHAPKGDFAHNKYGKVMMNLFDIPLATLQREPRNVHRPFREYCGPGVAHFPDALFYLNHYIGDWDRYNSRSDGRRNRVEWTKRAFVDDGSPPCESEAYEWLTPFRELVGARTAHFLLGLPES